MSASDLDVAYIARLARLDLTAEETALFQTQLAQVLEHAAKLARSTSRVSKQPPTPSRFSMSCGRMNRGPG